MQDPSYHQHPNWPMLLVATDGTPIFPPGLVAVWCSTPGCKYNGGVFVSITGCVWDVTHCDHIYPGGDRRFARRLAQHWRGQGVPRITRQVREGRFIMEEPVWQDHE